MATSILQIDIVDSASGLPKSNLFVYAVAEHKDMGDDANYVRLDEDGIHSGQYKSSVGLEMGNYKIVSSETDILPTSMTDILAVHKWHGDDVLRQIASNFDSTYKITEDGIALRAVKFTHFNSSLRDQIDHKMEYDVISMTGGLITRNLSDAAHPFSILSPGNAKQFLKAKEVSGVKTLEWADIFDNSNLADDKTYTNYKINSLYRERDVVYKDSNFDLTADYVGKTIICNPSSAMTITVFDNDEEVFTDGQKIRIFNRTSNAITFDDSNMINGLSINNGLPSEGKWVELVYFDDDLSDDTWFEFYGG